MLVDVDVNVDVVVVAAVDLLLCPGSTLPEAPPGSPSKEATPEGACRN